MLMPAHARMARAALKWSLVDLQEKTGLSKTTLVRFEAGRGVYQSTANKLEETFVKEGVTFIDAGEGMGPGIQLSIAVSRRIDLIAISHAKKKSKKRSQKSK